VSLLEAISEVKEELKSGSKLTSSLIEEIANDHGINPKLLERKLQENNITEESVKNFSEAVKFDPEKKLADALEAAIKRFRLNPDDKHRRPEVFHDGIKWTILCREARHVVALNHEDFQIYTCNWTWVNNSTRATELKNA
jgi:hypothetical protein